MAATPAAALPDELVEEIFLRLPPDDPASLLRASLTSKDWGRTISSPAFRRRLHDFHGAAPVLGFLHDWRDGSSHFIPTTASSFSLVAPDWRSWRAIDCRHGRALFLSKDLGAPEILVWEPITGAARRVSSPFERRTSMTETYPTAAVFCAADGCDHRDCHGGPFGLVFVLMSEGPDDEEAEEFDIWASVFSSETGTWDKRTLMHSEFVMEFVDHSSVLVGRSLLYFMSDAELILEYDLASHSMTLLDPADYIRGSPGRLNIMLTEDGGLGVSEYSDRNLKLWTKEASDGTDAHWVLSRVINLVNLLPISALLDAHSRVEVVGFAEGTNTIFLRMVAGIFIVELQSEKARKVSDSGLGYLFPVVSFYTPVPLRRHQDPPPSGSSEEAGCEERGNEEKIAEQPQPQPQPQQLFFD